MEFKQVVNKRRTVRDFSNKTIEKEKVLDAIYDAFKAPTYNHLKEWFFIIVDDFSTKIKITETERMIEELTDEIKSTFKDYDPTAREMYLKAIPKQKRMILEAPISVVVVYKPKTQISQAERVYDLNGFASIWCAIENLLLSLTEKDIFGVTFIPKNTDMIKEILEIPKNFEVASVIPIGYKKVGIKEILQKEIKIEEHIGINKWK